MAKEMHTLAEWVKMYEEVAMRAGVPRVLNLNTIRKRRFVADVGIKVPPRTYMLTREEFDKVLNTPLPMCTNIIG